MLLGEVDPARSASSITDFTNSSLAQRMFTAQERGAMRSHAQGVRDLDRNIEQMPITQRVEQGRQAYQDTFGGTDLGGAPKAAFQKMVEGTATPEEIANGVFQGHRCWKSRSCVPGRLQAIERDSRP